MHILFLILLVVAYLLGSLSSAVIICKLMKLPDPCEEGSKNPGATNVMRVGGWQAGAYVLLADLLKGLVPVLLAKVLGFSGILLGFIGIAAVLGHIFSVFLGFKGGKGVATALGVVLALSFTVAFVSIIVWLAVVGVTRFVSLASLIATATALILSPFFMGASYFLPMLIITGLIFWRHMENIERLRAGSETKVQW